MHSIFDSRYKEYDEWYDVHPSVYSSELEAVQQQLPHKGDGIEIGVGTGRFAVPFGITLGLEPSPAMAAIARERGINVCRAVAEDIPLKDASIDYVLMVTTICFLNDIRKALREVNRILRPEGALIVGFVDRESLIGRKYHRHKEKNVFYKNATFYSTNELSRYLEGAGFSELSYVQTLFRDVRHIDHVEKVEPGHEKGSFIVIQGIKKYEPAPSSNTI
jgi:ubiquinone/menaquinone biosynthesis C-methylase UbiE